MYPFIIFLYVAGHELHSDIKPENILISKDRNQIYLTDFGFSCDDEVGHKDGRCGTDAYISPETWVTNNVSNPLKDVWAIAMTSLFISLSGRLPWARAIPKCQLYKEFDLCYEEYMRNPRVLRKRLPISKEFEKLLLGALHPNPRRRMSLDSMKHAIWSMPHFLMSEKELQEADVEAQETAILIGLAEDPDESDDSSRVKSKPLPIPQITYIDPNFGDIPLQPIIPSKGADIPLFTEENPTCPSSSTSFSSFSPPLLESPNLSGSTVFEPVTPENIGIAPDPTIVDSSGIPSIEKAMAGFEPYQPGEDAQMPPNIGIVPRKQHEQPALAQLRQPAVILP
jgi:serine/threonine protein kinase